jgi:hypothetical protein
MEAEQRRGVRSMASPPKEESPVAKKQVFKRNLQQIIMPKVKSLKERKLEEQCNVSEIKLIKDYRLA